MNGASQSGFTLLELLVALVLLSLLTAGLSPVLRLGAHAWDVVDSNAGEASDMQTAQAFLRRSVSEAYPAAFVDQDGRRQLAYDGQTDSIAMVTPMPAYLGIAGLQIIRIGVEERDGVRSLIALWSPVLPGTRDLSPAEDAERTVLADGIDALDVRYYGRENANSPSAWFETWEGHAGLPRLVRLRVTFKDSGKTNWPDMLIRPMVDLGAMVKR